MRLRALRFVNLVNVGTIIALIGSFVVRFYWSLFTVFRRYDDTLVYLIRLIFARRCRPICSFITEQYLVCFTTQGANYDF